MNPKTVTLSIRIPTKLHEKLKREAEREQRSINSQIIYQLTKKKAGR